MSVFCPAQFCHGASRAKKESKFSCPETISPSARRRLAGTCSIPIFQIGTSQTAAEPHPCSRLALAILVWPPDVFVDLQAELAESKLSWLCSHLDPLNLNPPSQLFHSINLNNNPLPTPSSFAQNIEITPSTACCSFYHHFSFLSVLCSHNLHCVSVCPVLRAAPHFR